MFEVGKLTDESLDSFLGELEKVRVCYPLTTTIMSMSLPKLNK